MELGYRQISVALVFSLGVHLLVVLAWRMPQLIDETPPLLPPVVLVDLPEIAEETVAPPPPPVPPPPPKPKPPPPEPAPPEPIPEPKPKPPPPKVVPKPKPKPVPKPPVVPPQPAPTKPAPPPPVAKPVNVAPKADPVVKARYEQVLAAWLERHKEYPIAAMRRRMKGTGVMKIKIDRQGRVVESAIATKTSYSLLDDTMKKMVRRADPFPAMPEGYPGDTFVFAAPVDFRLP